MGKPWRPMSLRELLRGQVWSHCGGTNWTLPERLSTFHVDLHTNEPLSKCYPSYIFTGKCLIFTWIYLSKIYFVYVLSENVSVYVGKGNVCVLCMSVCVCQWGASLVSWGNPGTLACVSHLRPSTQEESTLTFPVLSLLYYERPFNPYHQQHPRIRTSLQICRKSTCWMYAHGFRIIFSITGHAFSLSTDKRFETHMNYELRRRLLNHPILSWMLRI